MKVKKYISLYGGAAKEFYRNPWVVIPGILLWIFVWALGKISVEVNYKLTTTISLTAWLIFFSVLILAGMGFIFSGLIGMAKKRGGLVDFFYTGRKFWFRNFLVLLIISVIGILLVRIAHVVVFYLGKAIDLSTGIATIIFALLYFVFLAGVVIFLMFGSFCLVIFNLDVFNSLRKSFRIVKKNYLFSLGLAVLIFVLLTLLSWAGELAGVVLEYLIVVPYLALVMTRFVLEFGK